MKLDEKVEEATKERMKYYKNIDDLEEVPIDILRGMYRDLLEENKNLKNNIIFKDELVKEIEKARLEMLSTTVYSSMDVYIIDKAVNIINNIETNLLGKDNNLKGDN